MGADETAVNGGLQIPDVTRSRMLEHKYIELLEKRIAALEALTADNTTNHQTQDKRSTNNERVKKFPNDNPETASPPETPTDRRSSVAVPAPKIRFRELTYNEEGVQVERDVPELDSLESSPAEQSKAKEDVTGLIWLRARDQDHKYSYSEVRIEREELRALLLVELAHDPDFHWNIDDTITLTSPFEPLIHSWTLLTELASSNEDSDVLKSLKSRIAKIGPRTELITQDSFSSALVVLAKNDNLAKARADLATLLAQIPHTPELNGYFAGLEMQEKNRSVQFEFLWTIFPPGELVYASVFMKKPQVFIVKEDGGDTTEQSDSGRNEKKVWHLICWSYDWNGRTFNRVPVRFRFEEFQGLRAINTLPCYPLKFHEDEKTSSENKDSLRKMLVRRGKRFRELCTKAPGKQMFEYVGDAISHGSGFQRLRGQSDEDEYRRRLIPPSIVEPQTKVQKVSGRVIVDFASYLQHAPGSRRYGPMGDAIYSSSDDECRCASCVSNEALKNNQKTMYDDVDKNADFLDETQYLICPPRVLGYQLDSRTWLELDISEKIMDTNKRYLEDIAQPMSKKAFQKLELTPAEKGLIKDLVESHTSSTGKKPLMEDIMKEKGRGLVILLHGPPGVGKTLTAESVAQLAGKPLFSVSPSDIGLNPADVEHNLEALFELAARWQAVLLFDEADVFLESRSSHTSDLTRNALVSVLLRVLEYYDGILILTTNRIQQFDIAVQSRVNLGIKYKDLTMDQKKRIYNNFIDQLSDDNVEDRSVLKDWLQGDDEVMENFEQLNGRQVRNVLFSAASLAMKEGGILKSDHIKKMARSTWKFQDSIKTIVEEARKRAEVGR